MQHSEVHSAQLGNAKFAKEEPVGRMTLLTCTYVCKVRLNTGNSYFPKMHVLIVELSSQ